MLSQYNYYVPKQRPKLEIIIFMTSGSSSALGHNTMKKFTLFLHRLSENFYIRFFSQIFIFLLPNNIDCRRCTEGYAESVAWLKSHGAICHREKRHSVLGDDRDCSSRNIQYFRRASVRVHSSAYPCRVAS